MRIATIGAALAAALFLSACSVTELAKHCTGYGPFKAGANGVGFGAAFACDASAAVEMQKAKR